MLRWYDQWLRGIDTGILNDPPVRFWVMGANEWRSGSDWPLPETRWVKFYLRGWERLTTEPFVPASADEYQTPDSFAQMPPNQTNRIQRLRYLSEPLTQDLTIAGPSVLNLHAAIDQDDTNCSATSARGVHLACPTALKAASKLKGEFPQLSNRPCRIAALLETRTQEENWQGVSAERLA
jgi:predicted acyl esterase